MSPTCTLYPKSRGQHAQLTLDESGTGKEWVLVRPRSASDPTPPVPLQTVTSDERGLSADTEPSQGQGLSRVSTDDQY